jgi:hypothetical protein
LRQIINLLKEENNLQTKIWKGVLFILFAIPGALIAVFAGIFLIASFSVPKDRIPDTPILYAIALLTGTFMTLLGLGKIKQWLYGLVFISMPLTFWLYALINPNMIGETWTFLAFIGGMAYLTFRVVNNFYTKKQLNSLKNDPF